MHMGWSLEELWAGSRSITKERKRCLNANWALKMFQFTIFFIYFGTCNFPQFSGSFLGARDAVIFSPQFLQLPPLPTSTQDSLSQVWFHCERILEWLRLAENDKLGNSESRDLFLFKSICKQVSKWVLLSHQILFSFSPFKVRPVFFHLLYYY